MSFSLYLSSYLSLSGIHTHTNKQTHTYAPPPALPLITEGKHPKSPCPVNDAAAVVYANYTPSLSLTWRRFICLFMCIMHWSFGLLGIFHVRVTDSMYTLLKITGSILLYPSFQGTFYIFIILWCSIWCVYIVNVQLLRSWSLFYNVWYLTVRYFVWGQLTSESLALVTHASLKQRTLLSSKARFSQ